MSSGTERRRAAASDRADPHPRDRHEPDAPTGSDPTPEGPTLRLPSDGDARAIVDTIDDAIAVLRIEGAVGDGEPSIVYESANAGYERLVEREGLSGAGIADVLGDDAAWWTETLTRVAKEERPGHATRIERSLPEEDRHLDVTMVRLASEGVARIAVRIDDLSAARRAEAALRESERRARLMEAFRRSVMSLMDLALEEGGVGDFDQRLLEEAVRVIPGATTGSILRRAADGAFRFEGVVGFDIERLRTVRMPPEAVGFGRSDTDGRPMVVRDPEPHPALDATDADTLRTVGRIGELRAVLSVPIVVGGTVDAYLTLDAHDDGDAFGEDAIEMARVFAGQVASLTKRFELERSLYRQAYQDGLTSLPNRTAFKERLQERLDAGRTYAGHAVLFVDLDNLKPINDSLGHPAGDAVLCEVARRIERSVRDDGFVARLGGDEFTVLISGRNIRETAATAARTIIEALQEPIDVEAYEVRVGASIGIGLAPHDGTTVPDLLRHADIAMYHAKTAGKGTFRFFADEMEAGAKQRVMLEGALREGLARDEFEVHYQPRVDLRSGRIVAAEALVRWRHPRWGMVPPGRFVSLAEATRLIHPLGRRVLELACGEAAGWTGSDGSPPPNVSVNMSRHQLQRADIVDEIADILEASGLPPARLELEVLESTAMTNVAETARTLTRLRALGVRVSLDDFGTGHSSLGWLQSLPVDTLKLDQTFVARLGDEHAEHGAGADDRAILSAILRLGQALGLDVVAEGIERTEQLAVLRQLGCTEGQGFLFCAAVTKDALAPLLELGSIAMPDVP